MGWRDFNKEFQQYRIGADFSQLQPVENLILNQYTNVSGAKLKFYIALNPAHHLSMAYYYAEW
ncbi:MAG: hypothetical protein HRU38_03995 [Saccharospirillaceae bacterium]|nr:hypothetical protein [Pseudomonadales bacterium]NRB77826.1 hypothetical protein [Saccharospirillaceae bacterium]